MEAAIVASFIYSNKVSLLKTLGDIVQSLSFLTKKRLTFLGLIFLGNTNNQKRLKVDH